MRKSANITAALAGLVWLYLAAIGLDGLFSVARQQVPGYPNSGQIMYYLMIPLCVLIAIAGTALVSNLRLRWFNVLGVVSATSMFGLLPYMFGYFGGI